ncbi:Rrf2 family transcriptional regulator [Photorhabdus khanii]|uniref:Rrf2 family transcriptional regulator n=1 Tax=Photorhabdus khanii TaxID=1004150 RepID=UPI003BB616B8
MQGFLVPTSTRFAVAIHILTDIALHHGQAVRSEDIAKSVNTNPTVVRRLLGALAEAGLTYSQMGQGGGALLACPPERISLLDIYRTVEDPLYFTLHRSKPNPKCYIGHNITPVLEDEFSRITCVLEATLAETTIADIVNRVEDCAGFPFNQLSADK